MPIRLVLADDDPLMLYGVERVLRKARGFRILGSCHAGEEVVRLVHDMVPDVLVIDRSLSGKDGLTVIQELKEMGISTRVILLVRTLRDDDLVNAMLMGVDGVLHRAATPDVLVECLRTVHAGERWLDVDLALHALAILLRREEATRAAAEVLTPREMEIPRMVASGLRNKDVAERLSLSEGTVKNHLHHIYEKLQLRGREELIGYARERGLA